MTSLANWLKQHKQQLKRIDLELLLCAALKKNRSWLFAHDDVTLSESQIDWLQKAVNDAQLGKPIALITGHKPFWTFNLAVNQHTLVPRPETELIIELALQLPTEPQQILDLGTGTGAIALALASEFPNAQVLASDFSKQALVVAKKNGLSLKASNVTWMESHWFQNIDPALSFDLIVSNPPYIDPDDAHLKDLTYEPRSALVADEHGLADLKHIINHSVSFMNPNGHLILEHGWDQGQTVRELFKRRGYHHITTHQDLAGKDRVSVGIKPS